MRGIPSLGSLIGTAMRTLVRRAVWSIPQKYVWPLVIVVVIISAIFGHR